MQRGSVRLLQRRQTTKQAGKRPVIRRQWQQRRRTWNMLRVRLMSPAPRVIRACMPAWLRSILHARHATTDQGTAEHAPELHRRDLRKT